MHRVTIESLAFGGFGFTRINGVSCFIPYALPGDEALIEVTDQSRGVNWGKLLEIYEPSPHRYEPICPIFEKCGGCQWLHFDYDEQIRWKSKLAEGALRRIGKIQDVKIEEIGSGIQMFGYRTRVRLHFKYVDDELLLGFHPPKSREVIDLNICPLIYGDINDLIYPIRQALSKIHPLKFTGSIELTQNPKNSETLIWLELSPPDQNRAGEIASVLSELENVVAVDYKLNPSDRVAFDITLNDIKAWVPPGSFSQSSFINNETLINLMIDIAGDVKNKRILDLYCGWGNLSLPLSAKGAHVTGFDSDANAIDAANLSVSDNRIGSAKYIRKSDRNISEIIIKQKEPVDILIMDPPRTGAKTLSREIAESNAKTIIYVSCNPNTLARDLKTMSESGRKLKKTFLIDMIPQTHHIETVNVIE